MASSKNYFDAVHSMPKNEIAGVPLTITDTPEIIAALNAENYDELCVLANAYRRQLRYRDAASAYTRALEIKPDDMAAHRQRAAMYLASGQHDKAIYDFERSLELGCEQADTLYRLGIALYLDGQYDKAMAAQEKAFPQFDDEMGIASMYWHTLSAYEAGAEPKLLADFRDDMDVGHHTAYKLAMSLAAGRINLDRAVDMTKSINEDLEYSMAAYGTAMYALHSGKQELADALIDNVVKRDSFWISYGYLAAWNEKFGRKVHNSKV